VGAGEEPPALLPLDPLGGEPVADPAGLLLALWLADSPPTGGVKRAAGVELTAGLVTGAPDADLTGTVTPVEGGGEPAGRPVEPVSLPDEPVGLPDEPVGVPDVPVGVPGDPEGVGVVADGVGVPKWAQRGISCWVRLTTIDCASSALRAVMPDFTCAR